MILVSKEMRILDMLDYHQLCMIYDYYFIFMNECKWNDAIVKSHPAPRCCSGLPMMIHDHKTLWNTPFIDA